MSLVCHGRAPVAPSRSFTRASTQIIEKVTMYIMFIDPTGVEDGEGRGSLVGWVQKLYCFFCFFCSQWWGSGGAVVGRWWGSGGAVVGRWWD